MNLIQAPGKQREVIHAVSRYFASPLRISGISRPFLRLAPGKYLPVSSLAGGTFLVIYPLCIQSEVQKVRVLAAKFFCLCQRTDQLTKRLSK